MSPQDDFLRYLGVAGATIAGLFLVQHWFASAMDVHWNEELSEHPANEQIVELRQQEQEALEQAGIKSAMAKVASNRASAPLVTPKSSDDLSPMSGWVQRPNFANYEPNVVEQPGPPEAAGGTR